MNYLTKADIMKTVFQHNNTGVLICLEVQK